MAGARARASVIVPCRFRRFAQPSTTPGTVTASGPYSGMRFTPRFANSSGVAARPARPLALSPASRFAFGSYTIANRSPPIPFIVGSTTERTAAAVTAASIALPPSRITCRPAADASGWLVAIIARRAITTDRVARGLGAGRSPGSCAGSACASRTTSDAIAKSVLGFIARG